MNKDLSLYNKEEKEECFTENLPAELKSLIESKYTNTPTLMEIIKVFYEYEIYEGIDCIHDNYKNDVESDSYAEATFNYLCQIGDINRIEYFCKKYKSYLEGRGDYEKFKIYNERSNYDIKNYDSYCYEVLFESGLSNLCTKKKVDILRYLYDFGFSPSIRQLKAAARTEDEDTFYLVMDQMNKELIADYIPILIEDLAQYTKLSPIKFLIERLGEENIDKENLSLALESCVNTSVKKNRFEIFKFLLEKGANIKANDYKVLEYIFGYGHLDILDYLYSEMNIGDDDNWDLRKMISLAIDYDKVDVIKYIIENEKYKNTNYNLLDDIELIVDKCAEYRKRKETMNYLIKDAFNFNEELVAKLREKYPKQRILISFLNDNQQTTLI